MIISLRGTNGAGKSTIVRAIMRAYPQCIERTAEGRQKPLCYHCFTSPFEQFGLMIPGHYEIKNGGIDTLPDLDGAYSLIEKEARAGHHVLYEGKNMSDGPTRAIRLKLERKLDVRVILVSYPLEQCIAAVRQRGHSIKEQTIEKLYEKSFRDAKVLADCGVPVEILPRIEAHLKVREWLGLPRVLRPAEELQ